MTNFGREFSHSRFDGGNLMSALNTEADVVYLVENWFRGQGYDTRLELRWRPLASTDLAAWKGSEFVAVECKLKNWKAALMQAVSQGKAFDKVFIAVGCTRTGLGSRQLREILEDKCPWSNYVGVLGVSELGVQELRSASSITGWPNPLHRNMVAHQFFSSSREGQQPFRPVKSRQPSPLAQSPSPQQQVLGVHGRQGKGVTVSFGV